MKLREFVSETLKEIIGGVEDAQDYTGSLHVDARINPTQAYGDTDQPHISASGGMLPIMEVEFDVAVTSTDATESQAGAGIFVAALGLGAKGKSDISNSSVSRIKFSVPVQLPSQN